MADAVQKGAKVVVGGHREKEGSTFYEPTLLTDVTSDMICCSEETFGPMTAFVK